MKIIAGPKERSASAASPSVAPQRTFQKLITGPHLPEESRQQVVERLATLAPTPIEVVEKVVEVLNAKAGVQHSRGLNQTGGLKAHCRAS